MTVTPGNSEGVAEIAFALMLSGARKIPQANSYVKNKEWMHRTDRSTFLGVELSQKTLGIIGLGRIGSIVARIGKGFDMKLVYYDLERNKRLEDELSIMYLPLEQLLTESDFFNSCPIDKRNKRIN
ncbi:MAG: glyoxylate reductase [Thermoproteota archaeon]|nr:glyoxylate reductase [Thermoproteota archaeon]